MSPVECEARARCGQGSWWLVAVTDCSGGCCCRLLYRCAANGSHLQQEDEGDDERRQKLGKKPIGSDGHFDSGRRGVEEARGAHGAPHVEDAPPARYPPPSLLSHVPTYSASTYRVLAVPFASALQRRGSNLPPLLASGEELSRRTEAPSRRTASRTSTNPTHQAHRGSLGKPTIAAAQALCGELALAKHASAGPSSNHERRTSKC